MSHNDEQRIRHLLQQYFDALYYCDADALAEVLHEEALYACMEHGNILTRNMADYFKVVSQRHSPHSRGEPRRDHIISIDIAGPDTALAKVNCSIAERYFTDYLSLLKSNGRWWIISKVFHYETTRYI